MAETETAEPIRAFNRFWTNHMGVLDAGLLDTPYSLTEARLIFELGSRHDRNAGAASGRGTEVLDLRRELRIDAGYLSRIVKRFERDGLVEATPSPSDGRRRVLRLTDKGAKAFDDLDARSTAQALEILSALSEEDRRRLTSAMATIRELLEPGSRPKAVVIRPPIAGDLGWVVHRHGVIYAQEFGWDETFEGLVARVVAQYVDERDPLGQSAWMAEVDGQPVGCVFCVRDSDEVARLRLLLVEPGARGMGIGRRLVKECVGFARRAGYDRITLWTNDVLHSARRIYEAEGFRLIQEEAHHSFGHDLVGQDWLLDLRAPEGSPT